MPIVRGGQVFGVLTVQNKAERVYAEEEVEALQTVAMVLAEVVAQGGFFNVAELDEPELRIDRPRKFMGDGLSRRRRGGPCRAARAARQGRAHDRRQSGGRTQAAGRRHRSPCANPWTRCCSSSELDLTGEGREVIEAYRLFAYDQGWRQRMRDAVRTGLTAEAAVERVQDETRLRVQRLGDPILRERAHDFDDLARRLLRHLTGDSGRPAPAARCGAGGAATWVRPNCWIMAATSCWRWCWKTPPPPAMSPSWRAPWACRWCRRWKALPTMPAAATPSWWTAKAARCICARRPRSSPPSRKSAACGSQAQARFAAVRDLPAITRDGVAIKLMMNAGLEFDMPHLKQSGADGIGLFRTELQFMIGETMPRLADQSAFYKTILDAAGDKPVVFRTLDLGGDKVLPYARWEREENPALGWRAIRIALDRPALLRYQVRALLAACAGPHLAHSSAHGVSDVDEFNRGRALIDRELERARLLNQTRPTQVLVGAMLEVPALAFMLPQLMRSADFVSIGSNDLLSLAFAVDRTNPRVASRYDNLNPASLTLIRLIVQSAAENSGDLSLCGEMAGRPLDAMALLGLGLRTLSMQPGQIGPIKMMIRSLHLGEISSFVDRLCGRTDHCLRTRLSAFAAERGIVLK